MLKMIGISMINISIWSQFKKEPLHMVKKMVALRSRSIQYLKLEWKSGTTTTRQINVHVSYDDSKYINTG